MGNGVVVSWKVTFDVDLEEAETVRHTPPKGRPVVSTEQPPPSPKEQKKQANRERAAR